MAALASWSIIRASHAICVNDCTLIPAMKDSIPFPHSAMKYSQLPSSSVYFIIVNSKGGTKGGIHRHLNNSPSPLSTTLSSKGSWPPQLPLSLFLLSLDSSSTSMLSQVKLSTLSTHKTSGSSRRREGGGGGWRGEEDAQDEDSRTNSPYSCDIYYVIVWGVKRADMSKPMLPSSFLSSLRHGRGREKTNLDPSTKEIIPECQCSNPRHMMHGM